MEGATPHFYTRALLKDPRGSCTVYARALRHARGPPAAPAARAPAAGPAGAPAARRRLMSHFASISGQPAPRPRAAGSLPTRPRRGFECAPPLAPLALTQPALRPSARGEPAVRPWAEQRPALTLGG